MKKIFGIRTTLLLAIAVTVLGITPMLRAQSIAMEGETGIFTTPTAYTVASPKMKFALPTISYHYIDGGDVIGDFNYVSATSGFDNRFEFGYTRSIHVLGDTSNETLRHLWTNGYNIFSGKGIAIKENSWNQKWVPSVAVGFIVRSQVKNVGGVLRNKQTTNGDVYLAVSKVITQLKPMPVLITGGLRGTDAALWGIAGNATGWSYYAFGNVGFIFQGPVKSTVILGAEVSQQPQHIIGLPTVDIRTTEAYAVRVLPTPKYKLNIDFGVLHGPETIAQGINLKAGYRPVVGVSYAF